MSTFNNREQAFEGKFFHDEDMKFRAVARSRKMLGLWAAEHMRATEEESLTYAMEIVKFGVENNTDEAIVHRIFSDMQKAGVDIKEEDIDSKMRKYLKVAAESIKKEWVAK